MVDAAAHVPRLQTDRAATTTSRWILEESNVSLEMTMTHDGTVTAGR